MLRRADAREVPVTNLILHTIRSNWCGTGHSPITRKYARVVGIEAPIDATDREYPVKDHVRTRRIQLPENMVERLRNYLTKWERRSETTSSAGSDEMLDFPFWMQTEKHLPYGAARAAAEKIIDAGQQRHTIYDRLGLGQIGVFGYITPPGYLNSVKGAVVGLGDYGYRPHCLFGQDGVVGVASLNAVNSNLQEIARRRQLPDTVHRLQLFADPGRP